MKNRRTRLPISGKAWWIGIVCILSFVVVPADARSGTKHLLAHVRASLPKKTAVPVRLPRWIPKWIPESNDGLTAIVHARRNTYEVILAMGGCEKSINCQAMWIYGERLGRKPPKLHGIKLRLRRGLIGYYTPAYPALPRSGSSNTFASMEIDQNGFRYSFFEKQGDRAEMVHIALSAFDPPVRKSTVAKKPVANKTKK